MDSEEAHGQPGHVASVEQTARRMLQAAIEALGQAGLGSDVTAHASPGDAGEA